eukprot:6567017-Prymnesium_polylepis.1
MRSSPRSEWIVSEWLRVAQDECRHEANVHPRNQNAWMCGVHRKVCAHERVYMHSKLVGHQNSRAWQHLMMGGCWANSHKGEKPDKCSMGKETSLD